MRISGSRLGGGLCAVGRGRYFKQGGPSKHIARASTVNMAASSRHTNEINATFTSDMIIRNLCNRRTLPKSVAGIVSNSQGRLVYYTEVEGRV